MNARIPTLALATLFALAGCPPTDSEDTGASATASTSTGEPETTTGTTGDPDDTTLNLPTEPTTSGGESTTSGEPVDTTSSGSSSDGSGTTTGGDGTTTDDGTTGMTPADCSGEVVKCGDRLSPMACTSLGLETTNPLTPALYGRHFRLNKLYGNNYQCFQGDDDIEFLVYIGWLTAEEAEGYDPNTPLTTCDKNDMITLLVDLNQEFKFVVVMNQPTPVNLPKGQPKQKTTKLLLCGTEGQAASNLNVKMTGDYSAIKEVGYHVSYLDADDNPVAFTTKMVPVTGDLVAIDLEAPISTPNRVEMTILASTLNQGSNPEEPITFNNYVILGREWIEGKGGELPQYWVQ